jgi:hypothetical protein
MGKKRLGKSLVRLYHFTSEVKENVDLKTLGDKTSVTHATHYCKQQRTKCGLVFERNSAIFWSFMLGRSLMRTAI